MIKEDEKIHEQGGQNQIIKLLTMTFFFFLVQYCLHPGGNGEIISKLLGGWGFGGSFPMDFVGKNPGIDRQSKINTERFSRLILILSRQTEGRRSEESIILY